MVKYSAGRISRVLYLVAIPLNSGITPRTLAAYPGLISAKAKARRISAHPFYALLHVEITAFHLPRQSEVLVSVALIRSEKNGRWVLPITLSSEARTFLPVFRTGQPHSACLMFS